jgi:hypothetical protein
VTFHSIFFVFVRLWLLPEHRGMFLDAFPEYIISFLLLVSFGT